MKKGRGTAFLLIITSIVLIALLSSALFINRMSTAFAFEEIQTGRTVVIIDAGHGGIDGGAVSCTGVYESHINLQIALRLRDMLNLLGIQTKLIRSEDISVYTGGNTIAAKKVSDLKERIRVINNTENGLLLSIHQNYFTNSRYSGAQVFHNGKHQELALKLQDNFLSSINQNSNRKAKKSRGVYLMEHVNCPAALIECGFLSNPQEEQLLRTDEYQKKICGVIATAVSCYIGNPLT